MRIHLRIVGGSIGGQGSLITDWPAVPRVGDDVQEEDGDTWTVRSVVWTVGDPVPYVVVR